MIDKKIGVDRSADETLKICLVTDFQGIEKAFVVKKKKNQIFLDL